jgi:hypothetical protein
LKSWGWLLSDFDRKFSAAAGASHGVGAFFAGKTELCAAERALFVHVLLVCLLCLTGGIAAEFPKELAESVVFSAALFHVAGEKTEDGVAEETGVQQGTDQTVPKHSQNCQHQRGPDANVVNGIGAVSAHQKACQALSEGRSVSKHMQILLFSWIFLIIPNKILTNCEVGANIYTNFASVFGGNCPLVFS